MLDFILNFVFAWLGVLCIILTLLKFITRMLSQKTESKIFKTLNKMFMKIHFSFGNMAIFFGLIHGLYSNNELFSINLGTIVLIIIILLKLSFTLRKIPLFKQLWLQIHRVLSILLIVLIIWHVIDVGGINIFNQYNRLNTTNTTQTTTQTKEETTTTEKEVQTVETTTKYKDGTYTGVADAYGPNLTVEVTIKNDIMTNIEIVSHNEDGPQHYQRAFDQVVADILSSQTTDVDVVSRATYTSNGIMNAVQNALDQAKN